jgi:hypothetical protein
VPDARDKPVVTGLVALVGVAVVVGLLSGVAALLGSRMLGLGGGEDTSSGEPQARQSLYLPDPVPTKEEGGPLVTLAGTPTQQPAEEQEPTEEPTTKKPKKAINLAAGATEVSGEEQLYLSGTYPGGEGSILDIEYKINQQPWREFNLDVNVSGATFATYVYTSNVGTIKWRMWDKSRNQRSNEVSIRHG